MLTYDRVTECVPRQLPGTTVLINAIYDEFDPPPPDPTWSRWGLNCRPMNGANGPIPGTLSVHSGGRAIDIRANANNPDELDYGNRLTQWLTTHAERLGIQSVMWNGQVWGGPTERWYWRPISPRYHQHRDHIHYEQTEHAALTLTTETIMSLTSPHPADPLFDKTVEATGEYRGVGRYPQYRIIDNGVDPVEIVHQNGAPQLKNLSDMLYEAFGVTRPASPVTRAIWDPFARAVVLFTDADDGTFYIPVA